MYGENTIESVQMLIAEIIAGTIQEQHQIEMRYCSDKLWLYAACFDDAMVTSQNPQQQTKNEYYQIYSDATLQ